MAFEYGESYFGLRSFGSSAGDVKDASATVTATSGANGVNWIVTMGGDASTTVTSSATCSGEVVIIEDTSSRLYGDWQYGVGVFDGDDNLQTVVTATSSATAVGARVRIATATATVVSGTTANARRVPEGSALIDGASTTTVTTTGNGARVRTGTATSTTTSSITESVMRVRTSPQTANAVVTASATGVFAISASSTITVASTSAAICNRVRFGSGVPTAVASITVLGFATRGGIASSSQDSTLSVDSEKIFQGHAVTQPEASITATCNRVQRVGGIVSSTSGTATIGREKWELITNNSVTWTQIAA